MLMRNALVDLEGRAVVIKNSIKDMIMALKSGRVMEITTSCECN